MDGLEHIMSVLLNRIDDRIEEIIDPAGDMEKIASGFRFIEGPVWHPDRKDLIFSDIPGNGLYRWKEGEGVSLFRENSHLANGNTYDRNGNLITCEHATSRLSRTRPDGTYEVLTAHYENRQLNSPNDVIAHSDGTIYFTDPNSGRKSPLVAVPREQELPFQGVFRLDPTHNIMTLLVDDFSKPNGLCFSLDEKRLFINDTDQQNIRVFDLQTDGSLTNGRVWAKLAAVGKDPGVADGMKIDMDENLYCSGPGGIQIFDSNGAYLGRILTPEVAANFIWGDADMKSLYITATSSLYRLRVKRPGRRLF